MKHQFSYRMTKEAEGMTAGAYLREIGYSRNLLIQLKQTENGILQNGQPIHTDKKLQAGDLLETVLYEQSPSKQILPVPVKFEILYEDEDLLLINKPADLPVHPSIHNRENSLANGVVWYYREQGRDFTFRCINRLDRDTSGLLIVAKHMLSASILSDAMKKRRIRRTYLAITEGRIDCAGTVTAPIARREGSVLERCVDFEKGEPAVTHYTPLCYEEEKDLTLVSLQLETGRTHQIRVHMHWIHHPLIGDFLYYPRRDLISRQALHSWKLEFEHPLTKERMSFEAPMPEDMRAVISYR